MNSLIARLESATGRRETVEAFMAVGMELGPDRPDDFGRHVNQAARSESDTRAMGYLLLAALVLVPEGWGGEIMWRSQGPHKSAYVELKTWPNDKYDSPADFELTGWAQDYPDTGDPGPGRPAAAALAIAALRAREGDG